MTEEVSEALDWGAQSLDEGGEGEAEVVGAGGHVGIVAGNDE